MAKVVLYGTEYCPFCHRARALLEQKKITYQYIPVDDAPELRQKMEALSGRHTVPQIFIDEKPIGGCDDLYALEADGKLDELIS